MIFNKRWYLITDDVPREPSLLLIAKWGGELTPAGKIQAEDLGKAFRTLYPGGQGKTIIKQNVWETIIWLGQKIVDLIKVYWSLHI